ncbi:MAG: hypothetical protein KF891_22360 [Rhizobacter sp.]|nr:hypothetical protein [Rhizobacter sp.]
MQARVVARIAAVVLAGVVYVLGSHWLMIQTQASAWNVVGVLSPMLVVIGLGAWRSRHHGVAAIVVLALAALCVQAWLGIQVTSHALYLLQHAGVNFFLALVFGSTLRPGRTALITTLATRVHGAGLSPAHLAYTRRLTIAWVLLFLVIVTISLVLFFGASFESWAVFANLVTPVAIGTLFFGEHLLRYRLHPEFERSSVAQAINAYMQQSHKPVAPKVPQ